MSSIEIEIKEYIDVKGKNHFEKWFFALDVQARLKIRTSLMRMEKGNLSQVKSVGGGVYECKIHYGPGYRLYLGQDSEKLIIMLVGGTKKRQQNDIAKAKILWQEYKKRKKEVV